MKTAKEIAWEYYESIIAYKVDDYDTFEEYLNAFDELDYKNINLRYAVPPFIDEYENEIDIHANDYKKKKIVITYLMFVSQYLHGKVSFKQRQKIDRIKRKAILKANDIYLKAIEQLKAFEKEDYSTVKKEDIRELSKHIAVMLDNPLNKVQKTPTKSDIEKFLDRLFRKSRTAKKLKDIVK